MDPFEGTPGSWGQPARSHRPSQGAAVPKSSAPVDISVYTHAHTSKGVFIHMCIYIYVYIYTCT